MAQTSEQLKALIMEMPVQEASSAICSAVEEWPELYDLLIEGLDFELEDEEGLSIEDGDDDDGDDEDDDGDGDEDTSNVKGYGLF